MSEEDLRAPKVMPQSARAPGFHAELLAARGPNTIFSSGLWSDRQGWVWSPLFSETGSRWVRRRDTFVGNTALPREVWSGSMVQQPDGPTWCVTGKMADEPRVWVDTGPIADDVPGGYPRLSWLGAKVPGMGPAAQLALAPDGKVYLLHEGGCSLLRLNKLARGAKPKLPTWTNTPPRGIDSAVPSPSHVWEIEEVARRRWDGPRNDFGLVAFDATGVWFIPTNGPLIRVPLPR